MISSSTSDSDNSLHSLYFTSYHGLINYPQKIPASGCSARSAARKGAGTVYNETGGLCVRMPWRVSHPQACTEFAAKRVW